MPPAEKSRSGRGGEDVAEAVVVGRDLRPPTHGTLPGGEPLRVGLHVLREGAELHALGQRASRHGGSLLNARCHCHSLPPEERQERHHETERTEQSGESGALVHLSILGSGAPPVEDGAVTMGPGAEI